MSACHLIVSSSDAALVYIHVYKYIQLKDSLVVTPSTVAFASVNSEGSREEGTRKEPNYKLKAKVERTRPLDRALTSVKASLKKKRYRKQTVSLDLLI